jgi:pilus assembly protein CpaE
MRVGVLDMDLCSGNLASMLGVGRTPDLSGLVGKATLTPEAVDACAAACAGGVKLWGPCAKPEFAETISPLVEPLISTIANECDLVLVDTPTTCTDGVAQVYQTCDRLMVVSDERPGAVESGTRLVGLAQRLGVARAQIMRVSNRCDLRERQNPIVLGQGADVARAFRVADGYEDVEDMIAAGEAAPLAELRCDFADTCASMLAKTLVELGRLPKHEEAHAAAEYTEPRSRMGLFARIREAS